jgi:hypothetical protein
LAANASKRASALPDAQTRRPVPAAPIPFAEITFAGLCALLAPVNACGTPPRAAPAQAPTVTSPPSAVSRYFPLVDGTQWAYDAEEDDTGNKGVFVTRAHAMAGGRFSLETGQRSRVVEVRPEGITRVETGHYLLRAPLTVGAEWAGDGEANVKVVAVDRIVDVPAGKFIGCVDTVEEVRSSGADPQRRVTTTYCPEVGIVSLHAEAWENGRHVGERAALRSFGKPISIVKE